MMYILSMIERYWEYCLKSPICITTTTINAKSIKMMSKYTQKRMIFIEKQYIHEESIYFLEKNKKKSLLQTEEIFL